MPLEMGVVVDLWENKVGLKVENVIARDGKVDVVLRGKDSDPRVAELQEKLKGYNGEYRGRRHHRTMLRSRGYNTETHTLYRGELKGQEKERFRQQGK